MTKRLFVTLVLAVLLVTISCDSLTLTVGSSINNDWIELAEDGDQTPSSVEVTCSGTKTLLERQTYAYWSKSPAQQCPLGSTLTVDVAFSSGKTYTGNSLVFTAGRSLTIDLGTKVVSQVTISVDVNSNRRAVNPHIYGVNHASQEQLAEVPYTVNRKGGNAESRYNWKQGINNSGKDWYFMNNIENVPSVGALPEGTKACDFADLCVSANTVPIFTASLLGVTPLDVRAKKWGFSVSKYGAQQYTECDGAGGASWCQSDAGNGVKTNGVDSITGNDWADTSKQIDETFVQEWIQFLQSRGTPIDYWSLDNEWDLWESTHRDVHPAAGTYDEYWNATVKYAAAIKAVNANAKTFGPVSWGWCGYFYSPADGCKSGVDRQAHGDVPFIPYYLQKLYSYKQSHGVELVDYLDVHYYPQAKDVFSESTPVDDEATGKLRLRSVKSLYDPNYIDESWIAEAEATDKAVKLIPRMKQWISDYYPGLKLAITEYNFGADSLLTGALAQAEILGIFAREGVDLACRWVSPEKDSLVETAYKLYLNYDGAGSKVQGDSVKAESSDVDTIGAYAFHSNDNSKAYIVMINKYTSSVNTSVVVPGAENSNAVLYGFSQESTTLSQIMTAEADSSGVFNLTLSARSAVLLVSTLESNPASSSIFEHSEDPARSSSGNQQQNSESQPTASSTSLISRSSVFEGSEDPASASSSKQQHSSESQPTNSLLASTSHKHQGDSSQGYISLVSPSVAESTSLLVSPSHNNQGDNSLQNSPVTSGQTPSSRCYSVLLITFVSVVLLL